jgi:hypothetical protein
MTIGVFVVVAVAMFVQWWCRKFHGWPTVPSQICRLLYVIARWFTLLAGSYDEFLCYWRKQSTPVAPRNEELRSSNDTVEVSKRPFNQRMVAQEK